MMWCSQLSMRITRPVFFGCSARPSDVVFFRLILINAVTGEVDQNPHMSGTTYRELSDYRPGSCGRRNPIPVGAAPQAQPSGRTPDASSCYGDEPMTGVIGLRHFRIFDLRPVDILLGKVWRRGGDS